MKNKLKKINKTKGFTLLEMIVAIAVFTIVMTMAMESLLNINSAQKKIETFRTVSDNLNFALDAMSREIRTGTDYSVAGNTFIFTNADVEDIEYYLTDGQLIRFNNSNGNEFPLTDPKIIIDNLGFDLNGENTLDGLQPIVRINISAYSETTEKDRSSIRLQTSVSQLDTDS